MNFDTLPNLKEKLSTVPEPGMKDEYRTLILFGIVCLAGNIRLLYQLRTGTFSWLYFLLCVIFLGLMVGNLVRIIKRRKAAEESWNRLSETELKSLNDSCANAKVIGHSFVAAKMLVTNTPFGPEVVRLTDAVWLYAASSEETRNAVTSTKDLELCIVDRNKKKYVIAKAKTREESEVLKNRLVELLRVISGIRPNMLVGFSEENRKLFENDFDRMVEAAERESTETEKPQVPPSYNWEVSTDEETFGTPSMKHIAEILDEVLAGNTKYLLLTPPSPVDGLTFLQVTAYGESFKVALSKEGEGLYDMDGYMKNSVLSLIQTFIEERKSPDLSGWHKQ